MKLPLFPLDGGQQHERRSDQGPNHHARFKIEPARFIMENELPFWAGNVIKYVCRHDAKNGVEDLKKTRQYLDMQIRRMEGAEDWLG